MKEQPSTTRSHEHEIEIDAPIEAVWKAIADAEEITNWFAEAARVTPGVGGTYWVSWGEGQEGESRIDAWDPPRRLRTSHVPNQGGFDPEKGCSMPSEAETSIIVEYTLEARGSKTLVRLVHSGIPVTPDWDGFYDGTDRGWGMFFQGLRHYLENRPGLTRKTIMIMQPIKIGLEEAWNKLTGVEGLAATETLQGVARGGKYSVTTAKGDELHGEVILNIPPKTLAMTIESLDNALLSASFEEMGGATFFYMTLATYGWTAGQNEELCARWTQWLQKLLP